MACETLTWSCDGCEVSIGLERLGSGPVVLLLPALSSMSTRLEMQPLQQRLAERYTTVSLDWPGFGDLPRPRVDWRPELYDAFLDHVLQRIVPTRVGVIAAGHAAGYVLRHFGRRKHSAERLILLSATWRGPLPTMASGDRPLFRRLAKAFDPPVLGAALYALNVNRAVIGMMARGHVYADPHWLEGSRMQQKLAVARARGARHASARFVTGRLDPFASREQQASAARQIDAPILNLLAEGAPRKSRLEMEALGELANVETVRLPQGKLSFYEEFPDAAAEAIDAFLAANPGGRPSDTAAGGR